ncbi:MAG: NAD(P)/FAD-dependent oxidoreductase [Clostridiales bacterium]|nr:NAD(P)/FAD-dependent oxidoreductase [Clostridiales bacterium]MDD7309133.1 NAD(P)/FAD-dependent oxidoreductase [Eubacteriales bacterium]MDY5347525.1 NAD(P)/FAD-dependent oxidoreductase [Eubacteriales bacterium]
MTASYDCIVIGGGPAGMMAAAQASACGAKVLLCEKNRLPGRKLAITGKGRCNVTNDCSTAELLKHITGGHKFLYSAFSRFSPQDTMQFFESLGVPLKTERGNRVFPVSDRATDIVMAMRQNLSDLGVHVVQERAARLSVQEGAMRGVCTDHRAYPCAAVIVATGGLSYPATGSTGDGYAFAESCGHHITALRPSLVGLDCPDPLCPACAGLTLKNIGVRLLADGRSIESDFGELLFTHTGVSGPVVLSASAHMRDPHADYALEIDLKPALDAETLDRRILRDFDERRNKAVKNALDALLPAVLRVPLLEKAGIPADIPVHAVTKAQRAALCSVIKSLSFSPLSLGGFDSAVVTAGGVCLDEVDPKTMASKLVHGLFFAGEVLDLDAYTGGFNLQIAFSTGYAAGNAAAAYTQTNSTKETAGFFCD